jgi:hypothetical protein
MPDPALPANIKAANSLHKAPAPLAARSLNPRAIFRGTAVAAGGAIVMSTMIGVAAVMCMASDGLSLQTIAEQLRSKWDLQLFTFVGEVLMAVLGGYTAAVTADCRRLRHALVAGAAAVVVNVLIVAICGSPLVPWLVAASLSLVLPCAAVGGYLASTRIEPHASTLTT